MSRLPRIALGFILAVLAAAPAAHAAPSVEHGFIPSFDGTRIAYTFMLPDGPNASTKVPVVFYTHGWGGTRATTASGLPGAFLARGYAVMTWDARGFGQSGGEANIDSQEFEVRDVQALIDWVASRPQIQLDAPGDPRMGMNGGSYAGGIQLMTASTDHRVDAITPDIAWNDILRSLRPNGFFKFGWGTLLYAGGAVGASTGGLSSGESGVYAPQIHRAIGEAYTLNQWTPETEEWFAAKSPARYIENLRAPTLLTQGLSDTLFTVNEAIDNFSVIAGNGVPAKMVWYCGGHTLTLLYGTSCADSNSSATTIAHRNDRVFAWLDRYVKQDESVSTGAVLEYQLQDGTWASLPDVTQAATRHFAGGGLTINTVAPTSGQLTAGSPGSVDSVRVPLPVEPGEQVVGAPHVSVNAIGTAPTVPLFLKLLDVDTASGAAVVVDDQVTPVRLTASNVGERFLSGETDLAAVAWVLKPGHQLFLEISPTSNDYASSRVPAVVSFGLQGTVPVL